jgi:hypothetical protein
MAQQRNRFGVSYPVVGAIRFGIAGRRDWALLVADTYFGPIAEACFQTLLDRGVAAQDFPALIRMWQTCTGTFDTGGGVSVVDPNDGLIPTLQIVATPARDWPDLSQVHTEDGLPAADFPDVAIAMSNLLRDAALLGRPVEVEAI